LHLDYNPKNNIVPVLKGTKKEGKSRWHLAVELSSLVVLSVAQGCQSK
jgi:hypothetical protein